ncbi:uncharacterized protein DNG_01784 [Cephalotrichum gorgonifer]|uniref:Glucose receptor Git3 N-terminal domain-containing protein n=1 Tax=Cephalotrichum gorgonifer TaxID=2041049 RepID=A0AAE8MS68_9PEZI|nr:uncharacterized protein DNG_01784 [Cephalotrichum gorgonifer]
MDALADNENTTHSTESLAPLPPVLRHGIAAVAAFGLLSFLTSSALVLFLIFKLISWHLRRSAPPTSTPPEPESPPGFDHNGFLVPSMPLSPQREEEDPRNEDNTFWERLRKEPPNQFLILILNLFLADAQQALGFLLNLDWLVKDAIDVGSRTCWAQGWFVSNGDLASSIFITGIAGHTYLGVVKGYRLPSWAFYWSVGAMWGFVYFCNFLAVLVTDNGAGAGGLFVRAGAWCWWNPVYENMRLYLHYIWIFLSLATTSVIYTVIFFHLRRLKRTGGRVKPAGPGSLSRSTSRAQHYPNPDPNWAAANALAKPPGSPTSITASFASTTSTLNKDLPPIPDSARQQTFLLYPLIYLVCTVPLAVGRLASMGGGGDDVSLAYFCFAGSMIACNGWLDVALYTYTRRAILFADGPPSQDTGIDTFAFMRTPPTLRYGNVIIVSGGQTGGRKKKRDKWGGKVIRGARLGGITAGGENASSESLKGFGMGKGEVMGMAIRCETTTTVSVEYEEEKGEGSQGRKLA